MLGSFLCLRSRLKLTSSSDIHFLHWDLSRRPAIPFFAGMTIPLTSEALGNLSEVRRNSLNICLFLRAGTVISQLSLPLRES